VNPLVTGVEIRLVRTEAEADEVRAMAWEFIAWLRDRYPDLHDAIDAYMAKQDFRGMLDRLLVAFGPPKGECLLALVDGTPAGILMLKPCTDDGCEMNRMFVRASARGRGVARALCLRLIERAREIGYVTMHLTALDHHHEALTLYGTLGFTLDPNPPHGVTAGARGVAMRLAL